MLYISKKLIYCAFLLLFELLCLCLLTLTNVSSGWKPSDGNIFVRYEFAFPHDEHQSGKTKVIAGTTSPGHIYRLLSDFFKRLVFMAN